MHPGILYKQTDLQLRWSNGCIMQERANIIFRSQRGKGGRNERAAITVPPAHAQARNATGPAVSADSGSADGAALCLPV